MLLLKRMDRRENCRKSMASQNNDHASMLIPSDVYYYWSALTSERVFVKQWYLGAENMSVCGYHRLPTALKMH